MTKVATIPQQTSLVAEPEQTMLGMLERIALNPDVTADKLERLLAIQERVMAKRAEDEFNAAMTAAQSETGRISADASNPQTKSQYATYAKLDRILRPIYTRHGFALSFGEGITDKPEYVRVICYVSHRGGHTRMYHRDMPADGKGAKGGDVMTKTHAGGAAQSYGMRYILKGVFNVAIGEDDNDGNAPKADEPKITEQQAADIVALVSELGKKLPDLCKRLHVTKIEDLPAKEYAATIALVQRFRK